MIAAKDAPSPAPASIATATDDDGVEFAVPADWPADRALPILKPNCVRCHIDKGGAVSRPVYDFAGSSHDHERLSCDTCHGGDITGDETAHEGNFISGKLSTLMERCADCHKPAFKEFRRGGHFSHEIRWDYPICSTCHDNHSVGRGTGRLADVCNSCHGSKAGAETGEGESSIVWRSATPGIEGNASTVALALPDSGAGREAGPRLDYEPNERGGVDLTVWLASDAHGNPATTAGEIVEAVRRDRELARWIVAEEGGVSLGEEIVQPAARFPLKGGTDFAERFPDYGPIVRANDGLWRALAVLRADRDAAPFELVDKILDLREDAMDLIHAVPKAPDPEEGASVVERSESLAREIDFLNGLLELN